MIQSYQTSVAQFLFRLYPSAVTESKVSRSKTCSATQPVATCSMATGDSQGSLLRPGIPVVERFGVFNKKVEHF